MQSHIFIKTHSVIYENDIVKLLVDLMINLFWVVKVEGCPHPFLG